MIKLSFIVVTIFSCGISFKQTPPEKGSDPVLKEITSGRNMEFLSPLRDSVYRLGQNILFRMDYKDTLNWPDSIQFSMNGKREGRILASDEVFAWKTELATAGTTDIQAIAFRNGNPTEQASIRIRLFPTVVPVLYTYKVINTYPHRRDAYTQGFIFDRDKFIESNGLYEQSVLRESEITTGKVLKEYSLPSDVFGEGAAVFDDKIIQVSWKEQVAFVYDRQTFHPVNKLKYSFMEGWGITYDGKYLILSDGSAKLYFLDKDSLSEIRHVEVCDERGPVERLNELEYIDGEVWANVYTTDTIVRIDPRTGVIKGKIDMSGLLSSRDRRADTNVLNGIAYDPKTKRIWVTGKKWPKVFEVAIIQKGR